jgi:sugar phosphate isomerase/epimerase
LAYLSGDEDGPRSLTATAWVVTGTGAGQGGAMTIFSTASAWMSGAILPAEDAIRWAAANGVRFLDVQTDLAPNALATMPERAAGIRRCCEETGVALGLHTLSGVNIAEVSPHVREAADAYLRSYIDLAVATGAGWVIVHAGYHFTGDYRMRRQAGLERLKRAVEYAEERRACCSSSRTPTASRPMPR